jgi:insertion element IS1 protein InsB
MYDENMECKNCKCRCVKNGKHKTGVQRYYCKGCRLYQQLRYIYKGCEKSIVKEIEKLTTESCGIRSISRVLEISEGKVIKSIKQLYRERLKVKRTILFGKEYELDEMRTYIGNKKRKYWVVYAIDRATREVVDFKVGKRTTRTLKRIVDTLLLAKAKKIYTDKLNIYKSLIPETLHERSKYKINRIERKNLSVRTHLKRLSRKTICFSKTISMLEATLGVYFWKNNSSYA